MGIEKIKVVCPNCREVFEIFDHKKYVDCSNCKEEFKVPEINKDNSSTDNKKNDILNKWDKLFKK